MKRAQIQLIQSHSNILPHAISLGTALLCFIVTLITIPSQADEGMDSNTMPGPRFGHTLVQITTDSNDIWSFPTHDDIAPVIPTDTNAIPAELTKQSKVYLFGGAESYGQCAPIGIWVYDPNLGQWNMLPPEENSPVPSPRFYHSASVSQGKMYVYGGSATFGEMAPDDMWCYDPNLNLWNIVPSEGPSPGSRFLHSQVTLPNDNILIMGGLDNTGMPADNNAWIFDPNGGTWEQQNSPYPEGLLYGQAMGLLMDPNDPNSMGQLYCFGGYKDQDPDQYMEAGEGYTNSLYTYDPNMQLWQEVAPEGDLPPARAMFGYTIQEDSLYIFGGEGENYIELNDTWVYNATLNTWAQGQDLPLPLSGTQVAQIVDANCFLVYGGMTDFEPTDQSFKFKPFPDSNAPIIDPNGLSDNIDVNDVNFI